MAYYVVALTHEQRPTFDTFLMSKGFNLHDASRPFNGQYVVYINGRDWDAYNEGDETPMSIEVFKTKLKEGSL